MPTPRALIRLLDFFIPRQVLSSVFLIFALENVVDSLVSLYVPGGLTPFAYAGIYLASVIALTVFNVLGADDEELDELEDTLDDVLE